MSKRILKVDVRVITRGDSATGIQVRLHVADDDIESVESVEAQVAAPDACGCLPMLLTAAGWPAYRW